MAAINKAFVSDDDFKETSSRRRQDRPTPNNKGTVCHVDIDGIDDSRAPKLSQILATLPALLGAFVLGTYLGWASPVMPQFKLTNSSTTTGGNNEHDGNVWHLLLDEDQMSWVGSLINVGAVVGCLCGGYLMDRFGRKVILAVVFLLYIVGYLLITLAVDPSMLYVGRIVGGLAGGICCVVAPSYIGETTTISMRGALGMLFSAMMSAGILATSLLGWLDWRWISAICTIFPVVVLVGVIFVPDSPYFLVKQGRLDEAEGSLLWLRGNNHNYVKAELSRIEALVAEDAAQDFKFSDIIRPGVYKPVLIGIGLMVIQQLSGINAALFNSVDIFRLSGSSLDGLVSAVILNFVLLIAALSSSVLVERLGRKMLFLLSESLTCLSVVALGGYFYVLENDPATAQRFGWVPLTLLITFIAVFAAGVGPLPWLVAGEVMPAKFKGPGSSIVAFTNWITSFIVTKVFIDMQRSLTNAGTFWVFGSLCFVGILFGIFILPETKGKTPEQIQALFATDVSEPPKSGVNINSTTTSSVDQPSHF
ncbi:facilitated trehalose transporter Tret1-2 homolog [Daphnia pulex]|uniref:facilitated trehalose transporter Tret1-2 homolog n=1 Tax=Daphnia pulex TaxID=6669 RepID=UPI001EDEDD2B|nr:facilitated trehalose transporter Tret1-2 homolog [Daphnia pulex]